MKRLLIACGIAAIAWILAEVLGGLFFLALGVRLWRYEIWPLFFAITSPVVWFLAFVLIMPLTVAFEKVAPLPGGTSRIFVQLLFLMVTGPVVEVILNDNLFRPLCGRPLYTYLVLPAFEGSSSLLSPFYYATLILHVPFTRRAFAALGDGGRPVFQTQNSD